MKTPLSILVCLASLSLAGSALAQPVGGPAAKGNAPLKAPHTVNDGSAKPGANSFTEGQAREHIAKSGFTGVTGLTKGDDGVWRGQAMRDGQSVGVAMDFKGNVSTTQPASGPPMAGDATSGDMATQTNTTTMHHHRRHHHHNHMSHCANPGPNGVACSGVDKNDNGISDKEDRAIAH